MFARFSLLAATALALSGCATLNDNDVAARVDDEQITTDELSDIARDLLGEDAVRADMPTVVGILNNWVLNQVLRADLAASGVSLSESSGELTNDALTASINESFAVWQQTEATPIDDEIVQATYELGPVDSNIICPSHILVEDESTADDVLDLLDEGDDFVTLAAEYSIDGSAASGGSLGCSATSDFATQFIPEFVEAALDAEIGEPVGPVASQFGFHIILLRPYDDLAPGELDGVLAMPTVRFEFASRALDVFVAPRYGTFTASTGIVPLG